LNPQRLRATGGTGQRADIGGAQAVFTDERQRPRAGLEGQGRELDVDGGHTGLDGWQREIISSSARSHRVSGEGCNVVLPSFMMAIQFQLSSAR